MAGLWNIAIGGALAGASWAGPKYAAEAIESAAPQLLAYAEPGFIAGLIVAGVGVVQLIMSIFGGLLSAMFGGGDRTLNESEVDDLFKRAMVAMAAADGVLEPGELDMLRSELGRVRAVTVTNSEIQQLAGNGNKARKAILRDLKRNRELLSPASKRQFFEAAQWVLRSDFEINPTELKFAEDMAAALELDPERAQAIQASVKDRSAAAMKLAASTGVGREEGEDQTPPPPPTPISTPTSTSSGGGSTGS